eukprot:TRINITY_DN1098_c0_g1_i4.p1 TRINITY_DN1098_c0_g1~~TRINITY_DN1098_c0_g1_i4.p1  ORF type:complete len:155 (-),score=51.56 TRINITY_DN1098_c0_g1_i4:178-642(-)
MAATEAKVEFDARFAGSFVLDAKKSDSIEPLLVAEGIPWMYRKVAVNIVPTWAITLEGNTFKLLKQTSLRNSESVYILDGAEHETQFSSGTGIYTARLDAGKLVVEARVTRDSDKAVTTYVETFEVVDDSTLLYVIKADTGKSTVELKRYFNRT